MSRLSGWWRAWLVLSAAWIAWCGWLAVPAWESAQADAGHIYMTDSGWQQVGFDPSGLIPFALYAIAGPVLLALAGYAVRWIRQGFERPTK